MSDTHDSQASKVWLPKARVYKRYDKKPPTLDRWLRDPKVNFPPPGMVINGREYWDLNTLDDYDRSHAPEKSEVNPK